MGKKQTIWSRNGRIALGFGLVLLLGTRSVFAQAPDERLWGTNGTVTSVAHSGRTLYVGGSFTTVGPSTGGAIATDPSTGAPQTGFPRVSGAVFALAADGAGGWYVGGVFTAVEGQFRTNLAHIRSDRTITDWAPQTDGPVWSLIASDSLVVVGGAFTVMNGVASGGLAAIAASDDAHPMWAKPLQRIGRGPQVLALALSGETVFAGGSFDAVDGLDRRNVAAFDLRTGATATWNPDVNGDVEALATRDSLVFIGGVFSHVGDSTRTSLAAVDCAGTVIAWNPQLARAAGSAAELLVAALCADEDGLYVGGRFATVGGEPHSSVAKIDYLAGTPLPWAPTGPAVVYSIIHDAQRVYLGGIFSSLGDSTRMFAGAVDRVDGRATSWNPKLNNNAYALGLADDAVYVGGGFTSVWNWQSRQGLAAIDLTTGIPTAWDPHPQGYSLVTSIAVDAGLVYVAGAFTQIGGAPRVGVAAIDSASALATTWNAGCDGSIAAVAISHDVVYVGGQFTAAGGAQRADIAALDRATGLATRWDPQVYSGTWVVDHVVLDGDRVYFSGPFTSVAGQPRAYLAAVDTASGALLDWRPDPSGYVQALLARGGFVYVSGTFDSIGGKARDGIAAVDRITGSLLEWHPAVGSPTGGGGASVRAMDASDSMLYMVGDFATVDGQPRYGGAAFDLDGGELLGWNPDTDQGMLALDAAVDAIYVGGSMTRVAGLPQYGLAKLAPAHRQVRPPEAGSKVELLQSAPNPALASAMIAFRLPRSGLVALTVYDLQGRVIAYPLRRAYLSAGLHEVQVQTDRWTAGCYLYRLETEIGSATRKMIILP